MYDPTVGKWITEDPIGFDGGDGNLYRYVKNVSTGRLDPFGLMDYKLGRDDPPVTRDPGAGKWNSKTWTYAKWAEKMYLLTDRDFKKVAISLLGPNAYAHFVHYLGNTGRTFTIDLKGMLNSSSWARNLFNGELSMAMMFAESLPVGRHYITSTRVSTSEIPQSQSSDWYFAVNGYQAWGKGFVGIHCIPGRTIYHLSFEYKVFDRYNWDGGKAVTILGIPFTDEHLGEFHIQGLAKEFDMVGTVRTTRVWIRDGQPPHR